MNKGVKIALVAGICVLLVGVVSTCYQNTNTSIEEASSTTLESERFVSDTFSYPYVIDFSYSKVVSSKSGLLTIPIYKDALLTEKAYLTGSGTTNMVSFYLRNSDRSESTYIGKYTDAGASYSITTDAIRYSYFEYNDSLFRIDWGDNLETIFDYFAQLMARYQNCSTTSGNATEAFYASFNSSSGVNSAGFIIQTSSDYLSIYNNETWNVVSSFHDSSWFELIWHDTIEFSVDYSFTTTDDDSSGTGSGTGSGGGLGGGGGGSW